MGEDQQPNDETLPEGASQLGQESRFQFTLPTIFLVTGLSAVLFWALGGMFQHRGDGDVNKGRFVLITLMAPVGMVLLLAAHRAIFRRRRRKKRKRW